MSEVDQVGKFVWRFVKSLKLGYVPPEEVKRAAMGLEPEPEPGVGRGVMARRVGPFAPSPTRQPPVAVRRR